MAEYRVIKKYPNRRLYDTEISRYITLEEVRQLVLENIAFKVEDKRTQEDITRTILLQVISEQEEGGDPIFTTELLSFIIRFYGDPMQSSISRYLELSLHLFVEQQATFSDQLKSLLGQAQHPLTTLKELADRHPSVKDVAAGHVPIWRTVRREFLRNLSRSRISKISKKDKDSENAKESKQAPTERRNKSVLLP